jgi:hypothetical protein
LRPTTIITLIAGVLVGLGALALAVWSLVDRDGGMFWFYWIAPLLVLGVGGMLVALAFGYWDKVGKLEVKGRPKSE